MSAGAAATSRITERNAQEKQAESGQEEDIQLISGATRSRNLPPHPAPEAAVGDEEQEIESGFFFLESRS